jgi:predicted Zn-dependent peptidase
MQKPILSQLNNGLRAIKIPYRDVSSVTINLRGFAGSNFEKDTEIGAAHLLEHLILKGSKNYSNEDTLKSLVTFGGGKIIAATSRDEVTIAVHVLAKELENALLFLSEIFYRPLLQDIHLPMVKQLVTQEITRYNDMPEQTLVRHSYKALFPKNRISILNTGEVKHIDKLQINVIEDFYKRTYTNNRFVLSLCGNLDIAETDHLLETYFNIKTNDSRVETLNLQPNTNLEVYEIRQDRLKQAYIKIDFYGYTLTNPARYKAELLAKYLDILIKSDVINKGAFSYKTNCDNFSSHNYGVFSVFSAADEQNLATITGLIKSALHGATQQINSTAMQHAKNSYIANMLFKQERVSARSEFYAELLMANIVNQDEEYIAATINKISETELMETAKQLFDQQPKITIITPSLTEKEIKEMWLSY